jgi:hypothetical protein
MDRVVWPRSNQRTGRREGGGSVHFGRWSTQDQRGAFELAVGKVALPGALTGRRNRIGAPLRKLARRSCEWRAGDGRGRGSVLASRQFARVGVWPLRARSAAEGSCENLFI